MTLQELTSNLPKERQLELALKLIKFAMPIWDKFADNNKLWYRDTVVGLEHSVERNLLLDTINEVGNYLSVNQIQKIFIKNADLLPFSRKFSDPIVALQDSD